MATTTTAPTTTPPKSYLNQYLTEQQQNQPPLSDIGKRVTETIQTTAGTPQTGEVTVPRNLTGPQKDLAESAIESFRSQVDAAERQRQLFAESLKTKAAGSEAYIGGLRSLASVAVAGAEESLAAWNKYTGQADQYLRDSAARMAAVTQDIKGTIDKYAQTNDSALAHSIQSASYTWLQTSKGTERGIKERYGGDSPEYRDYLDAKRASIGSLVSDLTAKAWDRTQQILNTGIGALATAETQLATDVNLAQKNALDAYEASAMAGDQYRLQTSAFLLNLAAAENAEWAELANWINDSPVTAIDSTPLFSLLNELSETAPPISRGRPPKKTGPYPTFYQGPL
ncbi:MAG: hypothetical protein V2A79_09725 [Planctomycetota bacterium]